jgi:hypothetical protein
MPRAAAMPPKRFKAELRESLLELHWRQWCALGVAGQVEPERHWVVYLEALVVSVSRLGQADARLLKRGQMGTLPILALRQPKQFKRNQLGREKDRKRSIRNRHGNRSRDGSRGGSQGQSRTDTHGDFRPDLRNEKDGDFGAES